MRPYLIALFSFREPVNAWSHALWLVLSVPATVLLYRRSVGGRAKRLSLVVFGLSLAFCYAGSTLFHAVRLPEVWIRRFDTLDHVGIFILIAGSYTPITWNNLRGPMRWATLAAAWSLSALGSVLLLTLGAFPVVWSTLFYLAMGWAAVICYFEMARSLSHRVLFPLLLGGILYSAGALINLAHWPVIWPGVFGAHELFHVFVMGGSMAHFWFMLDAVAPASVGRSRPEAALLNALATGRGRRAPALEFETILSSDCTRAPRIYLRGATPWGRDDGR